MKKFLVFAIIGLFSLLSITEIKAQGDTKIFTKTQLLTKGDSLYLRFSGTQFQATGPLGYSARLDSIFLASVSGLSTTRRINHVWLENVANKASGTATLVAGTVTVSNTSVTATSIIRVKRITPGGTLGHDIIQGAIVPGTSFIIKAITNAGADHTTETSTVWYEIVN